MLVDAVLQKTADKYTQRVISQGIPNRVQRTAEKYAETAASRGISNEGDAVDFLTRIYRSVKMPLIIRIDCAKVVAPFERPRLTAIANRDRKDMQQSLLPPEAFRLWARQPCGVAPGARGGSTITPPPSGVSRS
jgi:hypothetical protein